MCHFIALTLPSQDLLSAAKQAANRFHRRLQPLNNPYLQSSLRPGEITVHPSGGNCDCGTALGLLARRAGKEVTDSTAQLRKKGWSDAKIQRWSRQRQSVSKRQSRTDEEAAFEGCRLWSELIEHLIKETGSPSVGLLLHWYSGQLESEKIQISTRRSLALDDKLTDALSQIEEDVIYDIQRSL